MWKNLNFNLKVLLLVTVFIIFSTITALGYHYMSKQIRDISIESSKQTMLNGYKGELKDMVDVMAVALSSTVKGISDEKEIYALFSELARSPRFLDDKSGYFFIYENGGIPFMHATKPHLEGKNLFNLQDANGTFLIQDLESVVKRGGGFTEYLWDKPGKGNQPKLSYARKIPYTKYWIGTGIYIDDIDEKEQEINTAINTFSDDFLMKLYAILGALFLFLIVPLTIFMSRSMVKPLENLTNIAAEYSKGNLKAEFDGSDERKDEIGALSRAVKRLGRSTEIAMDKLHKGS